MVEGPEGDGSLRRYGLLAEDGRLFLKAGVTRAGRITHGCVIQAMLDMDVHHGRPEDIAA